MGWWFGRKSAPEIPTWAYGPPAWLTAQEESGFVRSYDRQLSEVYRSNPVGLRAVRLVAGAIGGLPLFSESDEAVALVKEQGLLEAAGASLLLHGNAYVQLIADSHDRPRELALLRPERVSIATDERGYPSSYVYRVGGRTMRIAARDGLQRRLVAHVKGLNPVDDHLGLGCLDAAIAAASIHNRASRWNKALLDNAARPSGALSYEP
jgi:phage portal protein BeeE